MKTKTFCILISLLASGSALSGELICYPSGDDTVCEQGYTSYYCYQDGENRICEEE